MRDKGVQAPDRTVAVIPAAGAGLRMGTPRPKPFLQIGDQPLLALTLRPFGQCEAIDAVVVVVPAAEVEICRDAVLPQIEWSAPVTVVAGGPRRQDSVRIGLEAAGEGYTWAMIHDGVRPMVTAPFLERLLAAARQHGAVVAALPAKETVKEVRPDGFVQATLQRERLWLVQTPQVFPFRQILAAHRRAQAENWEEATDDAALLERVGVPVSVVVGLEENVKVTTPEDLERVRWLLAAR